MSTEPSDRAAAAGGDDEKLRRALEIHERLMREHNIQFYNRHEPDPPSTLPAQAPPRGEDDAR
jgi:hypothetical protein